MSIARGELDHGMKRRGDLVRGVGALVIAANQSTAPWRDSPGAAVSGMTAKTNRGESDLGWGGDALLARL